MRYDEAENRILISCRELVRSARRGFAAMPNDSEEPVMQELTDRVLSRYIDNPFRELFLYELGKNSRRSRRISRGGALHRKGERNSRVMPPFPESPDVSVHSRKTCFLCTASTCKQRIDSHHGGTWDIPVGKPRGKATDPLIHAKGSATLLLQLGRKAHVHHPTRDED